MYVTSERQSRAESRSGTSPNASTVSDSDVSPPESCQRNLSTQR